MFNLCRSKWCFKASKAFGRSMKMHNLKLFWSMEFISLSTRSRAANSVECFCRNPQWPLANNLFVWKKTLSCSNVVSEYTYLGIVMSTRLSSTCMQNRLATRAQSAVAKINKSLRHLHDLELEVLINIFNTQWHASGWEWVIFLCIEIDLITTHNLYVHQTWVQFHFFNSNSWSNSFFLNSKSNPNSFFFSFYNSNSHSNS